jgi:uncharacterized membrane protein HdeD (DUF308 family)
MKSNQNTMRVSLQTILEKNNTHWGWLLIGGFLAILGGWVAISSPFLMGVSLKLFLGWMMLAAGFYSVLYTIESRHEGRIFRKLLVTALYFIAGLFLVMNPVVSLVWLTLIAGFLFIAEGISSLSLVFSPEAKSRRGWLAISAVLEIGLGLYAVFALPSATQWLLGTLWGIHMIILGINLVSVAFFVKRGGPTATTQQSAPLAA